MSEDFRRSQEAVPKGYACTLTAIEGGYLAELQRCHYWSRYPYGPVFAAKDVTMTGAVEAAAHRSGLRQTACWFAHHSDP